MNGIERDHSDLFVIVETLDTPMNTTERLRVTGPLERVGLTSV